jgi:hypothetical protein
MKARDFIKPGENVIVIFTKGALLKFDDNNSGSTGNWEINLNRSIDRVIIYCRHEETKINTLYVANYAGVEPSDEENRYIIKLEHIQYIGTTPLNWLEFAKGSQKPVQYFP